MNRESFVDWVVHWVPSGDQPRFKEALERELRRWFLCDEAFDVTCTCKMVGCSFGCMKTQRDVVLARAKLLRDAVEFAESRLRMISDAAELVDAHEHRLTLGTCRALGDHLRAALDVDAGRAAP